MGYHVAHRANTVFGDHLLDRHKSGGIANAKSQTVQTCTGIPYSLGICSTATTLPDMTDEHRDEWLSHHPPPLESPNPSNHQEMPAVCNRTRSVSRHERVMTRRTRELQTHLIYRSEYRAGSRMVLALCSTQPCGCIVERETKEKEVYQKNTGLGSLLIVLCCCE